MGRDAGRRVVLMLSAGWLDTCHAVPVQLSEAQRDAARAASCKLQKLWGLARCSYT